MKISERVVEEALKRMGEAEFSAAAVMEIFQEICENNPQIGDFIENACTTWKENPPPTLDNQLAILFTDLVVLADIFKRQEEVDKLEELLNR